MRAALRITWLLLSLSSLFPGIFSEGIITTPTNDTSTNITSIASITSNTQNATVAKTGEDTPSKDGSVDSGTKGTTAIPPTVKAVTTKSAGETASEPAPANSTIAAATITTSVTIKPEISTSINPASDKKDPPGPTEAPSANLSTSAPKTTLQASTTAGASTQSPTATVKTPTDSGTSEKPSEESGSVTVKANTTTVGPTLPSAQTSKSESTTPAAGPADSNNGTRESATTTSGSTLPQDQGHNPTPGPGATSGPGATPGPGATSGPTDTTSSQSMATGLPDTKPGTTWLPTTTSITTTLSPLMFFTYTLNSGEVSKENVTLEETCKWLMSNWVSGSCNLTYRMENNKPKFVSVEIKGKVENGPVDKHHDDLTKVKEPTDNKTLIAILASCGALLIMIVILAVCASHHRKPYNENQQHLTEELNTVENGYHDNPTLEVMEVQPEMQEKKVALNGEFNDNWIVPMDNLIKEDIPEEEDTHL